MTLSQEFGDRPLVPGGISGDLPLVEENEQRTQKIQAEQYRSNVIEKLAKKVQDGTATKQEEDRLEQMYSYEVGQGYN